MVALRGLGGWNLGQASFREGPPAKGGRSQAGAWAGGLGSAGTGAPQPPWVGGELAFSSTGTCCSTTSSSWSTSSPAGAPARPGPRCADAWQEVGPGLGGKGDSARDNRSSVQVAGGRVCLDSGPLEKYQSFL